MFRIIENKIYNPKVIYKIVRFTLEFLKHFGFPINAKTLIIIQVTAPTKKPG